MDSEKVRIIVVKDIQEQDQDEVRSILKYGNDLVFHPYGKAVFNDVLPAIKGGAKELAVTHNTEVPPSNNTLYFEDVDRSNFSGWSADIIEKYRTSECSLLYYCIAFTVGPEEQKTLEGITGVEVVQNNSLLTNLHVCTTPGCGRPFNTKNELKNHKLASGHSGSIETTLIMKDNFKPNILWEGCPGSGIISIEKEKGKFGWQCTVFFRSVEGQNVFLSHIKWYRELLLKNDLESTGVLLNVHPYQLADNVIMTMFADFEIKTLFKQFSYAYICFEKEEDFREAITTRYTVYGAEIIPRPVNESIKVDPSNIKPAGFMVGQMPGPAMSQKRGSCDWVAEQPFEFINTRTKQVAPRGPPNEILTKGWVHYYVSE